jgi:hypothetical protein
MTQRNKILQELADLQSSLANAAVQNAYEVPVGYFDGLADQLLRRVKALETENASRELNHLSPLLSGLSKEMPYSVPAGYFENFTETIHESVLNSNQSAFDELEKMSPLLSSLKKEMPYSVPQNYFEQLTATINAEAVKPAVKVVSITRQKWFRYAAAAVVIGFIAIAGFLLISKKENIDPATQSSEWVNKNLKKVSTDEINSFVELTDQEAPVIASIDKKNEIKDKNDVQDLIKDISDKEIQKFLDETQPDNPDNSDDALMN